MEARVATARDLDAASEVLAGAFEHDPLWSWALPDRDAISVWWRLYLESALRAPEVLTLLERFECAHPHDPPHYSRVDQPGQRSSL